MLEPGSLGASVLRKLSGLGLPGTSALNWLCSGVEIFFLNICFLHLPGAGTQLKAHVSAGNCGSWKHEVWALECDSGVLACLH